MHLRTLTFVLLALLLSACGRKESQGSNTPMRQAVAYYEMLRDGRYAQFLDGTYGMDNISDDYRQQRLDLLAQHAEAVRTSARGGYDHIQANRDSVISDTLHIVFLDIQYCDSTQEQIICPLVLHEGRWLMCN